MVNISFGDRLSRLCRMVLQTMLENNGEQFWRPSALGPNYPYKSNHPRIIKGLEILGILQKMELDEVPLDVLTQWKSMYRLAYKGREPRKDWPQVAFKVSKYATTSNLAGRSFTDATLVAPVRQPGQRSWQKVV